MQLIGLLVGLIYRSLFHRGEEGVRRSPCILKLLLLLLSVLLYKAFYLRPYVPLTLFIIFGALGLGLMWTYSSFILSSIPAAWYGITAYLYWIFEGQKGALIENAIMIYLRATYISFIALLFLAIISPIQVSRILHRLGFRKGSLFPLLLWRITPAGISNMMSSLVLGTLKGENSWRRLGPALASMIEEGQNVWKINYYRLESEPLIPLEYSYSLKYSMLTITFLLVEFFLLILSY